MRTLNGSVLLKRARSSFSKASKQITKEAFERAEDSIAAEFVVFAPCLPESDFVAVLKTDCESGGFNLYRLPLCLSAMQSCASPGSTWKHSDIVRLA